MGRRHKTVEALASSAAFHGSAGTLEGTENDGREGTEASAKGPEVALQTEAGDPMSLG